MIHIHKQTHTNTIHMHNYISTHRHKQRNTHRHT